jgi:EmrB/QacA subfamily drug resistance transporter
LTGIAPAPKNDTPVHKNKFLGAKHLPKHILVPLIVACALFMQQLDATALATSLPAIAHALNEQPVRLHLAITVYMLSLAAFLPVSGWVADRYGARQVFRIALAVFTIASGLCGLSDNFEELIGARILQGIGGAMMVPVARLILVRSVEKVELVRALAVMSMPALIGPILGPLVGGFLTSFASWRWIFWINLPVGVLGIVLVTIFIENVREEPRRFDVVGALLSGVALSAGLFGMDLAASEDRITLISGTCLIVGALGLVLYFFHARRTPEPIIDLTLFRIATFRSSMFGGSIFRLGAGGLPFALPLLFQQAFGYTPFQSGLVTFVSAVGSLGMRTISTRVLARFGFRTVLKWDGFIAAAFTAACIFFRAGTPYLVLVAVLFFGGLFRSLQLMSINALSFADLSRAQMSHGTALSMMAQRLSQSISIALTAFILHSAISHGLSLETAFMLAFAVLAFSMAISSVFLAGLQPDAGADMLGRKPERPAAD